MNGQHDTHGAPAGQPGDDFFLSGGYLCAMPFLALVNETEVELADQVAIVQALREGRIDGETWIKDVDVEADWEALAERFPELLEARGS
ncbi:MAG: hypothetical protein ACO1QR_16540 [Chthoniobacteraceae bacterium]